MKLLLEGTFTLLNFKNTGFCMRVNDVVGIPSDGFETGTT